MCLDFFCSLVILTFLALNPSRVEASNTARGMTCLCYLMQYCPKFFPVKPILKLQITGYTTPLNRFIQIRERRGVQEDYLWAHQRCRWVRVAKQISDISRYRSFIFQLRITYQGTLSLCIIFTVHLVDMTSRRAEKHIRNYFCSVDCW